MWAGVSEPARELITSLLQLDPARRPDAEALLQHPWIQGRGVSAAPIPDAASNLLEFQRAKRKLRTALVASMHQQASIRKRHSGRQVSPLEQGPNSTAASAAAAASSTSTSAASSASSAAAPTVSPSEMFGDCRPDSSPAEEREEREGASPPPHGRPGAAGQDGQLDLAAMVETDL